MLNLKKWDALGCAAIFAAVTGCGGGGDSGATELQPTGKLVKSVVNLQCEPPQITISQLDTELDQAGLDVQSKSCAWDGLGRIAACGSPSVYLLLIEVPRDQVGRAFALDYKYQSDFKYILPMRCPSQ